MTNQVGATVGLLQGRPQPKPSQRTALARRADCAAHAQLEERDGKPFVLTNHFSEYKAAKLIRQPKELKQAYNIGFKPKGAPRKVGGRMVYPTPTWHFG